MKKSKGKRANGEGSVYFDEKGKRWRSEIQYTEPSGDVVRKRFSGKTRAEAAGRLREFQTESALRKMSGGDRQDDGKTTFLQYAEHWLQNVKRGQLKSRSFERLEDTFKNQVYPCIGALPAGGLTKGVLQEMINTLERRGLSYSTIKKAYDAVKACHRDYREERGMSVDPCRGIRLPSRRKKDPADIGFYTKEEIGMILSAAGERYKNGAPRYRLGAAVKLLIFTGMRVGELIALRWEDVDPENGFIIVNKSAGLIRKGGAGSAPGEKKYVFEITSPKTRQSVRRIPLCAGAKEALEQLKEQTFGSGRVISSKNGEMIDPRVLNDLFHSILERAGIPVEKRSGVHSLRHTFASLLFCNNTELPVISKILGHRNINVTANIYLHLIDEQYIRSVGNIDEFFKL